MSSASPALQRPADSYLSWIYLKRLIRWAKLALLVIACLILFMLVIETIRIYQTLSGIHPWLGVAGLMAVGAGVALVVGPAWKFLRMPRVVEPPPLPSPNEWTPRHLMSEIAYLDRYLKACGRNPMLVARRDEIAAARRDLAVLAATAQTCAATAVEEQLAELNKWTARSLAPVLAHLDERVDRLIYQESLAVGMATAVSPNGVLDAFVMMWRSVRLISEIGVLYYGRPGLLGTLAIGRDVAVAVATAGYMQNVTDSLGNMLAKTLGNVGGLVVGPAADGITNAVVLLRIGYLAKQRCRSYRHWDAATRMGALRTALSATQSIAVGLASEILRRVGGGVTAVAGKIVSNVGSAGRQARDAAGRFVDTAAQTAGDVAEDAVETAAWIADQAAARARSLGEIVGGFFRNTQPPQAPAP